MEDLHSFRRSTAALRTTAEGNEEELGGVTAFVFKCRDEAAITLESSGANLPALLPPETWIFDRKFTLGVRDVCPIGLNPEPVIRTIRSQGFYVWRPHDPSRRSGTSQ